MRSVSGTGRGWLEADAVAPVLITTAATAVEAEGAVDGSILLCALNFSAGGAATDDRVPVFGDQGGDLLG
ncbi:hypothetical protein D2E42_24045 [Mycobacteroides abscessus]|nr:hypothetical protein DDK10_23970 [Mycobacteroides abscessus]SHT80612.1 Uncharacterised protein [Mycobacteroides abscessus subsp. abscessus]RIR66541.1 hypothetical protein D2E42_24045 [Mycobacteroides abscessus]SHV83841.1 Uncharacterised protein [Mycobacteroides abscessus subsp. abscessus]SHW76630.1 Uncharacterised protein [Mycobacteroides abscessus subsp. abscessus]